MNQHISDIQNNLSMIERDLLEIKSDLKVINQSMAKAVYNSTWIKVSSAIFSGIIVVLMGILIYQMFGLNLLLS